VSTVESVLAEARSWIGTPWHHAGRVKGAAVDCAMLLAEVYERCGLIPHIEPAHYPPDWALHRSEELFLGWVERFARRVEGEPQPADVVLYKFGRCASHAGIVLEWPGAIIHAYMPLRAVTVTGAFDGDLCGRYVGAWRVAL
jgi:NlpC/P60 family putative phage cell wall peptidase